MSWSISFKANDKDEAQAELEARAETNKLHFPADAKAVVVAAIEALPDLDGYLINVSTHGHFAAPELPNASNMTVSVTQTAQ